MKKLMFVLVIVVLVAGSLALGQGQVLADPTTLVVDDDGQATATDCGATDITYSSIQDAVDDASDGDTIKICDGTYEEQLDINKDNLVLQGAGQGNTIIRSPATLAEKFATASSNKPIVYVYDVMGVTIKDLTVDGAGRGNGNFRFEGIAFHNAGGTVQDTTITGVRETPLGGAQHGVALYAYYNEDGIARSLVVTNNTINDYQKNGMALSGQGLTVTVTGNTVTGAGRGVPIAQNGIQVGFGAAFSDISGNTVTDNVYTQSASKGWVATGILIYQADIPLTGNAGIGEVQSYLVRNNTVRRNQANVLVIP